MTPEDLYFMCNLGKGAGYVPHSYFRGISIPLPHYIRVTIMLPGGTREGGNRSVVVEYKE